MQYQVPQFIEVEDKVIGPLTIKQFIYIAGTAGLCIVYIFYIPTVFAIMLALPTVALGASLAFYKINGKPFIEVLEAGFNYYTGAKFFLWKHVDTPINPATEAAAAAKAAEVAEETKARTPKLTRGKLSALALQLDVSRGGEAAEEPNAPLSSGSFRTQ